MQKILLAGLVAGTLLISTGCSNIFRAYRIDVVQGQVVTQEQVEQIKPGMTPAQVRFVLGTPLVTDTLSPSRWDYTYRFIPGTYAKKAGLEKVPHRRMSVFFDMGVVSRVEVDGEMPVKSISLPASKDGAVRTTESMRESELP